MDPQNFKTPPKKKNKQIIKKNIQHIFSPIPIKPKNLNSDLSNLNGYSNMYSPKEVSKKEYTQPQLFKSLSETKNFQRACSNFRIEHGFSEKQQYNLFKKPVQQQQQQQQNTKQINALQQDEKKEEVNKQGISSFASIKNDIQQEQDEENEVNIYTIDQNNNINNIVNFKTDNSIVMETNQSKDDDLNSNNKNKNLVDQEDDQTASPLLRVRQHTKSQNLKIYSSNKTERQIDLDNSRGYSYSLMHYHSEKKIVFDDLVQRAQNPIINDKNFMQQQHVKHSLFHSQINQNQSDSYNTDTLYEEMEKSQELLFDSAFNCEQLLQEVQQEEQQQQQQQQVESSNSQQELIQNPKKNLKQKSAMKKTEKEDSNNNNSSSGKKIREFQARNSECETQDSSLNSQLTDKV